MDHKAVFEIHEALTFDDITFLPNYSEVLPVETNVETMLTREIKMGIPLVSAAMDTVTESETAISMAREGGIGIIHRNMSVAAQAHEVNKVKKSESGMIVDPSRLTRNSRSAMSSISCPDIVSRAYRW